MSFTKKREIHQVDYILMMCGMTLDLDLNGELSTHLLLSCEFGIMIYFYLYRHIFLSFYIDYN